MQNSILYIILWFFVSSLLLPVRTSLSASPLDPETSFLNINRTGETYLAASPHALSPFMTMKNQIPYIIWSEIDSRGISLVWVKHREGGEWVLDEGPLNRSLTGHAASPGLAVSGNRLYAAWSETDSRGISQIYVKEWKEGKWIEVSESLNIDPGRSASCLTIAGDDSGLYIAWTESNPEGVSLLYVKQWDGHSWRLIGDGINKDRRRHALTPTLAIGGGSVYLAWTEYERDGIARVYVNRWNGGGWEPMGESINKDPERTAFMPSLSIAGRFPYIAWMEYDADGISRIYVRRWDGKRWVDIGESLNIDSSKPATAPSLGIRGDTPFVVWTEIDDAGIPNVYTRQWKQRTWLRTERSLNIDTGRAAAAPSIVVGNNTIFVAFAEDKGGIYRLYVKELRDSDFIHYAQGIEKKTLPPSPSPQEGVKRERRVFFTSMPREIEEKGSPPPLALQNLPRTSLGEIDWMAGIGKGILKPYDSIDPGAKPPLIPDLDVQLPVRRGLGVPDAIFPHLSHSMWLDCRNCHPSIFVPKRAGNPVTMHRIIEGEYCARCHGVVAFRIYDCFRCHSGAPK